MRIASHGIKGTTNLSVSQFCHTDERFFDIIVGAPCKVVSGRFRAEEYGNNQEYQAGYHGGRIDKSQRCCARFSLCEDDIESEANHDAEGDPLGICQSMN